MLTWKSSNFSFFSDIERKLFALIATSFYLAKEDCILLMQRIFSGEHIFKKRCNLNFLGVWAKIFKRLARFLRRNCQNCILRFQRNNVGVYLFWKKYQLLFFWVLSEQLCSFTESFSTALWKLHFFCFQRNIFDEKIFFIKFVNFYPYSCYELNFSASEQKVFSGVVKTAF